MAIRDHEELVLIPNFIRKGRNVSMLIGIGSRNTGSVYSGHDTFPLDVSRTILMQIR